MSRNNKKTSLLRTPHCTTHPHTPNAFNTRLPPIFGHISTTTSACHLLRQCTVNVSLVRFVFVFSILDFQLSIRILHTKHTHTHIWLPHSTTRTCLLFVSGLCLLPLLTLYLTKCVCVCSQNSCIQIPFVFLCVWTPFDPTLVRCLCRINIFKCWPT